MCGDDISGLFFCVCDIEKERDNGVCAGDNIYDFCLKNFFFFGL